MMIRYDVIAVMLFDAVDARRYVTRWLQRVMINAIEVYDAAG